jgi:hypothetical protein
MNGRVLADLPGGNEVLLFVVCHAQDIVGMANVEGLLVGPVRPAPRPPRGWRQRPGAATEPPAVCMVAIGKGRTARSG